MKKLLNLFFLVLTAGITNAQTGSKLSLIAEGQFAIPFNTGTTDYGQTRMYYQDGVGGDIKAELPLTASLHVTGSAGYAWFATNQYPVYLMAASDSYFPTGSGATPPGYHFLPLKAGLKYYLLKYFYADAELGGAVKLNSTTQSAFIYSGGIGVLIPITRHYGIDVGSQYSRGYKIVDYPFPTSQFGILIGYHYTF